MSSSAICGLGGTLTGLTGATEIQSWQINQTVDALDATSMASNGWGENIACLLGATGSVKTLHAFNTGPYAISATTGTSKYTIAGNVIVTKVTCETPVEGLVSYAGDFVFTGKITITNATSIQRELPFKIVKK